MKENLSITREELVALLERGTPVTILDVRPGDQREEWHIPGSIHVDPENALNRLDLDGPSGPFLPDEGVVVAVCAAGKSSLAVAERLRAAGRDAYSLEGGMKAWSLAANTATVEVPSTDAQILQVRRTGKGCLSYFVAHRREATVIDASLPVEVYLRLAEKHGWHISHVVDTHIHADHLSRTRALSEATGATLLLPHQERVSFAYEALRDGDAVPVGDTFLRALHTPGHTDDSMVFILDDAALFTGDTLFTEGVGRPDLKAARETAITRAQTLYDSLQRILKEVPPQAVVLPGHTARPAAFDGRFIGSSLRKLRETVPALSLSRDEFVERILSRIPPTPPNYREITALNEEGATVVEDVLGLEAGANRCAVS